jgi:hypothetical protein
LFWWFERNGAYTRCEVLELPTGGYEFRVVDPSGAEHIEQFADPASLAKRRQTVESRLAADGWTGPHGWLL